MKRFDIDRICLILENKYSLPEIPPYALLKGFHNRYRNRRDSCTVISLAFQQSLPSERIIISFFPETPHPSTRKDARKIKTVVQQVKLLFKPVEASVGR